MARDGERGRGDWKARLGSRDSGPYADASGDTGPVDIAAVRRDDALIDAIASDGAVRTESAEEYQLAALLADWRAELIAPPMADAPDLDAIVAAVNQEIGARQVRLGAQTGSRLRLVRPLLGAAAALALVFGGMTAFSYNAEPGDPLWRVKEVVFSEQAQSTVVQRTDSDLSEAGKLVSQDPVAAKQRLAAAKENAGQISDPKKHTQAMEEWNRLVAELAKVSPVLADQLNNGTSDPVTPTPTSGVKPTKPVPPVHTTPDATIMQTKPSDPSDRPTEPNEPPTNDKPTTPPPVTTTPPPVDTTTQPATPTTVSGPAVGDPTVDPDEGVPTKPPAQGNSGSTFVVPSGSGLPSTS